MSYCNNPIGDYVNAGECGESFAGGMRHALVFVNELPDDPSDGAEIEVMIAAGTAKLIKDIKVGISAPSEVTSTSYIACVSDPVIIYERELTWADGKVSPENVAFYNTLNSASGNKAAGLLLYECDAERATFIDQPVVFSGGRISPDNNDDAQRFEFTLRYRSKVDAQIVDAPANIFD